MDNKSSQHWFFVTTDGLADGKREEEKKFLLQSKVTCCNLVEVKLNNILTNGKCKGIKGRKRKRINFPYSLSYIFFFC